MRPMYTPTQHDEAERLRAEATCLEREIDELHGVCARKQLAACKLHAAADGIVPIEYARAS